METPTEEELKGWMQDPVTQTFRLMLKRWAEGVKDQWAQGAFERDTEQGTIIANRAALAEVAVITKILDMDYEQFTGALNDE